MIKINLLPHREEKRKQQIKDFYSLLLLSAIVGALIAIIVGAYNSSQISMQSDRVNFIKKENAKLDNKIKEIVDLRQEIDALKARQQAVEDLQGDRNQPVFLLSELVKYTPEGVYLGSLKQEVQKVTVVGYAQSQERVADYIRNLSGKSECMNSLLTPPLSVPVKKTSPPQMQRRAVIQIRIAQSLVNKLNELEGRAWQLMLKS